MKEQNLVDLIKVCKDFRVDKGGLLRKRQEIVKAVDKVSLSVGKKEHLSIVGESGSGKTTLARMILGLERPTSGRIIIDGTDITEKTPSELRPLRRDMQIVFQDAFLSLNPRMRVFEIVERPLRNLSDANQDERTQRVREVLDAVGLANFMNRIPSELSGGQRQRVAIARALSVRPKLMVLDEPTSALDISIQAQVLSLLREIQNNSDLTYIMITHNISIIHYLSVFAAVMYRGKLVELAETQKLLPHPLHPYTWQLIASMLSLQRTEGEDLVKPKKNPDFWATPIAGCPYANRCPKVMDRCRREEPPYAEIEKNHFVACFLY